MLIKCKTSMKKILQPDYFAVEINTGAINGFYRFERDAVDTSNELAMRWIGSKWIVAKRLGYSGVKDRKAVDRFSQDRGMQAQLRNLFVDRYSHDNGEDIC